jgi:hypothetical protein
MDSSPKNTTRPTPIYPYDKNTDTISLPPALEKDVMDIASSRGVPVAMKKVMELTGAGLKVSKDYIDNLLGRNKNSIFTKKP